MSETDGFGFFSGLLQHPRKCFDNEIDLSAQRASTDMEVDRLDASE